MSVTLTALDKYGCPKEEGHSHMPTNPSSSGQTVPPDIQTTSSSIQIPVRLGRSRHPTQQTHKFYLLDTSEKQWHSLDCANGPHPHVLFPSCWQYTQLTISNPTDC